MSHWREESHIRKRERIKPRKHTHRDRMSERDRESVNKRLADNISQSLTADCDRQVDPCQAVCVSLGSDWSFLFGRLVLD